MVRVDLDLPEFTLADLANRDLVLQMLKFEDTVQLGPEAPTIYQNPATGNRTSEGMYVIKRMALEKFGFLPSPNSMENYAKIIQYYYRSPTDYDAEILNSVVQFRENRLLYYQTPSIKIGTRAPDCQVFHLDNSRPHPISLYQLIETSQELGYEKTIVAAFSGS